MRVCVHRNILMAAVCRSHPMYRRRDCARLSSPRVDPFPRHLSSIPHTRCHSTPKLLADPSASPQATHCSQPADQLKRCSTIIFNQQHETGHSTHDKAWQATRSLSGFLKARLVCSSWCRAKQNLQANLKKRAWRWLFWFVGQINADIHCVCFISGIFCCFYRCASVVRRVVVLRTF